MERGPRPLLFRSRAGTAADPRWVPTLPLLSKRPLTGRASWARFMQWYRAYIGMASDPKFRVVARLSESSPSEVLSVWVCVLEHACGHEGSIHKLDPNDIAFSLDIGAAKVVSIMEHLSIKGMILDGKVSSWDRRQFVSDNVTKRVQAFRKRRGNVSETDHTIPEHINKKEEANKIVNGVGSALRARGASRKDYTSLDNRQAYARSKIGPLIGWETMMAAEDTKSPEHLRAVELARAAARKERVTWRAPK